MDSPFAKRNVMHCHSSVLEPLGECSQLDSCRDDNGLNSSSIPVGLCGDNHRLGTRRPQLVYQMYDSGGIPQHCNPIASPVWRTVAIQIIFF